MNTLEQLQNTLQTVNKVWFSKDAKFSFHSTKSGVWLWRCRDENLRSKINTMQLQQTGFRRRIDAVRYIDGALGCNIEQGGFWRRGHSTYGCPQHGFEIVGGKTGWLVYHVEHGFLMDMVYPRRFASRQKVLEYLVESYPKFLD